MISCGPINPVPPRTRMSRGLSAVPCEKTDPGNAARTPTADAERINFRREVFISDPFFLVFGTSHCPFSLAAHVVAHHQQMLIGQVLEYRHAVFLPAAVAYHIGKRFCGCKYR